jgi:hypothetical protein
MDRSRRSPGRGAVVRYSGRGLLGCAVPADVWAGFPFFGAPFRFLPYRLRRAGRLCARRARPCPSYPGAADAPAGFPRAMSALMNLDGDRTAKRGPTVGAVGSMTGGAKLDGRTAKSRPTSRKGRAERARRDAADLAPVMAELRAAGITSLHGVARALNARASQQRAVASGRPFRSSACWRGSSRTPPPRAGRWRAIPGSTAATMPPRRGRAGGLPWRHHGQAVSSRLTGKVS